jgi:hypothetical protein
MSTPVVAPPQDGSAGRNGLRHLDKVRGIFASLARFVNAQAIYLPNNPHFLKAAQLFEQSFRDYFVAETELVLSVAQYQILWREQVVYDVGCNTESIAFLLYKDGIGEISVHSAVSRAELEQLAEILKGALYNPSAQFDTATALWEAELPNVFYRVLDDQSDGQAADGEGSGRTGHEQQLRANDHEDIVPAAVPAGSRQAADAGLETLGSWFDARANAGADPMAHELRLQQLHVEQFHIGRDELDGWRRMTRAGNEGDELLEFLRGMLDFTAMRLTPPVIRTVNDTIERLVHFIRDEGDIATHLATLEIVAALDSDAFETGFAALPDRIEAELTNADHLLLLARGLRPANNPHDVLRYLSLTGDGATAAVCELLARSTDDTLHEKGCEVLYHHAGAAVTEIVERFDVENAFMATDAVRLLLRAKAAGIPPVVQRILASRDPAIRQCAIDYLVRVETDESAGRLCELFKDANQGLRQRAFASVGAFLHPLVVRTLIALCFADDAIQKTPEELEHMFRALGKAAGVDALPSIRQAIAKKHYLSGGKARSKRDKLLSITALKYIPGDESRKLLEKLSEDADQLVRTKALHVLKQQRTDIGSGANYHAAATANKTDDIV